MASDSSGYALTEEDEPSEFERLRQRTWSAAAPYLAAAVLAWAVAGFTEYHLTEAYSRPQETPPILRQSVLQTVTQALFYAGLGLFAMGLLVAVLRQHERWRRDLELALDAAPGTKGVTTAAQGHDRPVEVTPHVWDETPDHPDQLDR